MEIKKTEAGFDADHRCLGCRAILAADCPSTCATRDDGRWTFLTEDLPGSVRRAWRTSGVKYTATSARQQQVIGLMNKMTWVRPVDQPTLPMSFDLLIEQVIAEMGVGGQVGMIGYNPLARLRVRNCPCQPATCRCDEPGNPAEFDPEDHWPQFPLFALRVRWTASWQTIWMLDIAPGPVWLLDDQVAASTPTHASWPCFLDWCDRCTGSDQAPGGLTGRHPCGCDCHTRQPAPAGAVNGR